MEVVVKIAQLLLSLSILVIIHELGHFLFAKIFKTRVEKFYLFFNLGFSLFKIKRGETEYGMGWLPLGGYVKISGMIDESMDREQLKKPPQPYEFRSKPAWQRLLIMVGGAMFNLILALIIFASILFVWGKQYLPTENAKYGIVCDSLALEVGLRNGDKILSIDNQEIEDFSSIVPEILLNNAQTIQIERDGIKKEIQLPKNFISTLIKWKEKGKKMETNNEFISVRFPFVISAFAKNSVGEKAGLQIGDKIIGLNEIKTEYFDQFKTGLQGFKQEEVTVKILRNTDTMIISIVVPESGLLGIAPGLNDFFELKKFEYSFFQAIPEGIKDGISEIGDYFKQLKLIFNFETKAYESIGTFFSIGNLFPGIWNWYAFWRLTAFLSIMLGILNLLPIPALDGGHVMFLFYEMITGRKPSDKFLEYAQIVGLVLVLALVTYALKNDIVRFFFK